MDRRSPMQWVGRRIVRGFLAGLAKKGITVDLLERLRQVGPNKTGAKGSYTVYRIAAVRRDRNGRAEPVPPW